MKQEHTPRNEKTTILKERRWSSPGNTYTYKKLQPNQDPMDKEALLSKLRELPMTVGENGWEMYSKEDVEELIRAASTTYVRVYPGGKRSSGSISQEIEWVRAGHKLGNIGDSWIEFGGKKFTPEQFTNLLRHMF